MLLYIYITYRARGACCSFTCILSIFSVLDLDYQDTFGYTPLMLSVQHSHTDITDQLLEGGADVVLRSNAGHTVLDMAAQQGNVAAIRVIMQHLRGEGEREREREGEIGNERGRKRVGERETE